MGIGMEATIVNQLKKAQGETNDRLDRLVVAQERTNDLLEWVGTTMQEIEKERAAR